VSEVGGYFELELRRGYEFHNGALKFSSGRSAFRYLLRQIRPSKVFIPAFTCNSIVDQLTLEEIPYDLYHVNSDFEILKLPSIEPGNRILYINYFSLKTDYLNQLHAVYGEALVVDNSQAFFEPPLSNIDTFYSPRKFFGVPDGGYLYTRHTEGFTQLEEDVSFGRFGHLLGRLGGSASESYSKFLDAEKSLDSKDIRKMSLTTEKMLRSIDYSHIALVRQRNFLFLHSFFGHENQAPLKLMRDYVPMVYPLNIGDSSLRTHLQKNKIFTATYWPESRDRLDSHELSMLNFNVYLPIDQRLGIDDLLRIVEIVRSAV
jgi:hypothetical protein